MKINKELKSLGYRIMKPKVWGKPVGYSLFTYEEEINTWTNWFKSRNSEDDTMYIWNSEKIEDFEDFTRTILALEAYTKINAGMGNFEFLTIAEQLDL